jgi:DNA mismatch endonuclease (patch repair protein)
MPLKLPPFEASSRTHRWALSNRSKDTKQEIALRSALHRTGYRFRKHSVIVLPDRRVRPDIVFTRYRLAVFVDGCYWHGCPEHHGSPTSNSDYWRWKIAHNVERDELVNQSLTAHGWHVVRIWEHVPTAIAVSRLATTLSAIHESRPERVLLQIENRHNARAERQSNQL